MVAASPDSLSNDADALRALVLSERAEKRPLLIERRYSKAWPRCG
jgi:hypothetical protein